MKAMVLAAGLGLRMRPLTLVRAKPALPVLNRPLIHWTLDALAQAGIREVVINLHHLPGTIVSVVGDGAEFGLRVRYSRERSILGTAGALRRARGWLGDEPVLVVNGDIVFDVDLKRLIARHRTSGALATLALRPNPDPRKYSSIVTGSDHWVRSVAGLPRKATGSVSLFSGIHVLDPRLLDRLPAGPSDSVRDIYIPALARGEPILGVRVKGAWYDFGHLAAYRDSQLAMLAKGWGGQKAVRLVDRRARIAPKAVMRSVVVGAGAVIEEEARVADSVIWDGVRVGPGARVTGAVLAADVPAGGRVTRAVVTVKGRARIG